MSQPASAAAGSYTQDVGWSWGGSLGGAATGAGVGAVVGAALSPYIAGAGAIPGALIGGAVGFVAGGLVVGTYADPNASFLEHVGWGALVGIPSGVAGAVLAPAAGAALGIGGTAAGGTAAAGGGGLTGSYFALQAGFSAAETGVEYFITQQWGSEADRANFGLAMAGEVFLKNFVVNSLTGRIGSAATWGAKAVGLWATRQAVEIGIETSCDVGIRGRDLGTSVFVNSLGSIGGDLAFKGAGLALRGAAHGTKRGYRYLRENYEINPAAWDGSTLLGNGIVKPLRRKHASGTKVSQIFRGDGAPLSSINEKGWRKAFINSAGNLEPASVAGRYKGRTVTVAEHILGGRRRGAKANSPFISWSVNQSITATFGGNMHKLTLDVSALKKAIKNADVTGVSILSPAQVRQAIMANQSIDIVSKRIALSLAEKNGEFLTRGIIPRRFFKLD